jgi:hypothetical protein
MSGALIESFPEFGWTSAMKAYKEQESHGVKPKVIILNVNTHNTGNKNDFKNYKKVNYSFQSFGTLTQYKKNLEKIIRKDPTAIIISTIV